jgi:hypothetical protein
VVPDIVYQKATTKFVQWKDEEAVYGLNFNTDEEADQFVAEFQLAIDAMANLPEGKIARFKRDFSLKWTLNA